MICQTTIARPTAISGIGLHTGQRINMTLRPAEAGVGIVFHRKVEDHIVSIKATAENVVDRSVILSFSMDHLDSFRAVSDNIYTGWITLEERRPEKGPHMLGPYWPILLKNPFYVLWAHVQKQAVCPLDTTPDSRLWLYKLLGCDAVITDDSEITCRKLKKG